ncbi:MAG: right-handed parallel beta-helix repeat-containing protein [Myxococcales bacterium]|nr:right-handed parallel beta-helix repeat-containing protein [Myxococcales bacterium]
MRPFLVISLLMLVFGWAGSVRAHAAFIVNTTADIDDGSCELAPDGDCSLREAIQAANAFLNDHPNAPDTVGFDFGDGAVPPFTILLASPLPPITEGLILDGRSEPRFILSREHGPVIIIDGGGFDEVLRVRSDNTLILTVAFTNAAVSAIDAENADYLLVQGCYFGVHPETGADMLPGSGLPAFGAHAIHVRDTFRPRIGGQGELARNLIAGAGAEAVLVERSDNLVFHDNYIGLDPTGLEARPNALDDPLAFAVDVDTSDRSEIWDNTVASNLGGGIHLANATLTSVEGNKVGVDASGRLGLGNAGPGIAIEGDSAGLSILDNVISANDGPGVSCLEGALGPWIMKRNLIGVDLAQSDTLPNTGDGVRLDPGCDEAVVGDEDSDHGNLIAHNGGAGVRAIGGTTTIRGNAIFLNDGLAIDAGPAGRTDNDVSDASLPINFPEVTGFERQNGELRVQACVPPGAAIELYEALTTPDRSPGALRLLGTAIEGSEQDADDSVACSLHNEAAMELTIPIEASVTSILLTATTNGRTSELSDLLKLDVGTAEPDTCLRAMDCTAGEPICDPVFRRCVLCVDDAASDLLDAGCSPEAPRCVEEGEGKRCAEPGHAPPPTTTPPPSEPITASHCRATPLGDSQAGRELWFLIACAAVVTWRRRSRINT